MQGTNSLAVRDISVRFFYSLLHSIFSSLTNRLLNEAKLWLWEGGEVGVGRAKAVGCVPSPAQVKRKR